MNEAEYFKRVNQIFRPESLQKKTAVVVGTGSGGARVASDLGRLGVGLTLLDRPGELLEEHNIVRHMLGYDSLGKPKTAELARHIHNYNPNTPVECVDLDVTTSQPDFHRLVESVRPDLILACTDNQPSKHAINQAAVHLGIPVVGAGVYDGGIAGEVYITRPGAACYGCIAAELQLKDTAPKKHLNIDYNNIDLDEIRSTAALNGDISQIALIHTRVALNILLAGEVDLLGLPPEVNLIVFANRRVPGHFERPLHGEFFHIKSHPDCLACGSPIHNMNAEAESILASLPV